MNINLTLLGQAIAFALFVGFCMKYVWPPITSALRQRKDKIAEGLAAADAAERERAEARRAADAQREQSKQEAARLIQQAEQRKAQIIAEAKERAQAEKHRLQQAAEAEIAQAVTQAKESLRRQVAALAVEGAEKILGARIDQAAHGKLLNDLATKL